MNFKNAFYLKLGKGDEWAKDSTSTGKLRFGWPHQTLGDINAGNWDLIEEQLRAEHVKAGGLATRALHGLQIITQSAPEDLWITFYQAKLWWTRVASGPVEQDNISKFRQTIQPWSDCSVKNRPLVINKLHGSLAQLQGFRWTVCRVSCPELLSRILAGTLSALATEIRTSRELLAQHLTKAIKGLHPKDFEILVDLVFRHTGWVRESVLGESTKGYDLLLREPITDNLYAVQVKSKAGRAELDATVAVLTPGTFERVFFVVHSPDKDLTPATIPPIGHTCGSCPHTSLQSLQ
jgi:hypothetical protein